MLASPPALHLARLMDHVETHKLLISASLQLCCNRSVYKNHPNNKLYGMDYFGRWQPQSSDLELEPKEKNTR